MAKYLVTGGSGFIGSAIVRRLVQDGREVVVLDNNSRGDAARLADILDRIEFVQGDVRSVDTVRSALRGVDCCLHLAAVNGTENFYNHPELVLDVGLRGMLAVVDACRLEDVKDLIVASSSEAYQTPVNVPTDESVELVVPDPLNPRYSYGGSKLVSELITFNYCRNDFDRAIVFRPHNVYGPDMGWEHVLPQFIVRAANNADATPQGMVPFPIQGDGRQTRAFIFIDDFTDGLMKIIDDGEHMNIYHIGTQEECTIREIAEVVFEHIGRQPDIQAGPAAPGGTLRRCPDISKLKGLGFAPKINLRDGIGQTTDWYVANRHRKKG